MTLDEIKTLLQAADFQSRVRALRALKAHPAAAAIPLLLAQRQDSEFVVRSLVAMGLGRKQSAEAFAALLEMMKLDRDTNVQAEAANSLSLYGKVAVSHLVSAFYQNSNWLVRRSILAAMVELDSPAELLEICRLCVEDEDLTVREAGLSALAVLVPTPQASEALAILLAWVDDPFWRLRLQVARSLRQFDDPQAQAALARLRQDPDHRVVGATLETLVPDNAG